jgi:hypothetical protein
MKETFEEYSRRVYGHEKFVSNLSDKQAIWDYQQSHIDELEKMLKEAMDLIKEMNEYLDFNKETVICSSSSFHCQMKLFLGNLKKE